MLPFDEGLKILLTYELFTDFKKTIVDDFQFRRYGYIISHDFHKCLLLFYCKPDLYLRAAVKDLEKTNSGKFGIWMVFDRISLNHFFNNFNLNIIDKLRIQSISEQLKRERHGEKQCCLSKKECS